jgi:hypothetical protein
MQAYIEIEHSELFLKQFYGPNGGNLIPAGYTASKLTIPLLVTVPTHDAASGSVFRSSHLVDGKKAFIFDVTDGVDTYSLDMLQEHMGLPVATVTVV